MDVKQRRLGRMIRGNSLALVQRRRKADGVWVTISNPKVTQDVYDDTSTQRTESEKHDWPSKGSAFRDVGGPFYTAKQTVLPGRMQMTVTTEGVVVSDDYDRQRVTNTVTVFTPFETVGLSGTVPRVKGVSHARSSDEELETAGATAISRVRPTASAAELSVALGETYKDGLPHLVGHRTWRDRTQRARDAGSEYLNVQFGWVPLVNDVSNFGSAVINSNTILNQYDVDKGKLIRRQYRYPDVVNQSSTVLSSSERARVVGTSYGTEPADAGGVWRKSTATRTSRWFSGAFVYGVPHGLFPAGGLADMAAKADRLFGISLTPDVLWNLAPWSWAVDWFTNIGDCLSTAGDMVSQGLVMPYGYLMETKVTNVTYTLEGAVVKGRPVSPPPCSVTYVTKSRVRANPFGFGITWDGLSSAQVAILAALGISRT